MKSLPLKLKTAALSRKDQLSTQSTYKNPRQASWLTLFVLFFLLAFLVLIVVLEEWSIFLTIPMLIGFIGVLTMRFKYRSTYQSLFGLAFILILLGIISIAGAYYILEVLWDFEELGIALALLGLCGIGAGIGALFGIKYKLLGDGLK